MGRGFMESAEKRNRQNIQQSINATRSKVGRVPWDQPQEAEHVEEVGYGQIISALFGSYYVFCVRNPQDCRIKSMIFSMTKSLPRYVNRTSSVTKLLMS